MKICGPKCALCGVLISIWGIIQLVSCVLCAENHILLSGSKTSLLTLLCQTFQVLMGIFYYIKSVALIEDLPIEETHVFNSVTEFYTEADRGYTQVSSHLVTGGCR